ncbi:membrane protein insertase YidC [Actinoplanes sp. N902-109]|uniref:membrane protein insertase YidC n=1 Tax=Actinoplanes sp. (strain N902-109) TaxID=649831 RepID=UPI0003294DB9|nr:membrane protein insertase YidC [Actinoplanes sp. N902-109]AGL21719.1 membrane protein insertase, YidC/Oxa1 family [Actinoplanes sp. N902-109]
MSLDWIYYAISWILLRWHALWDAIGIPDGRVLGTNWAWILSIVFLVVTLRVILFPVFVKQIKSQRAMQALQPKVKELQEKHKGDRETLQKEMMELYKTEKANPLMGCLPMFLQIPVFLGLFHTLRRLNPDNPQPTLYGWTAEQFRDATHSALFTTPLPAKFGSSTAELTQLGYTGSPVTVKIIAGVLVLIMMATTYLTSRQMILKTGWAEDPQQKMIQRLMLYGIPLSLLVSGSLFPIGVVIYWVTNNLFSLGQQQWVLRKFPPPQMANKSGGTAARPATGASAGKAGGKSPVQPAQRGLFGRKQAEPEPTTPAVDTKALAPKPGAKPANPKKGARPATKPKG